ncbi:MAG: hypothetical protein M1559_02855 [Candidatus Marsarchaeota archaeon]|jgi:type III secretory pathway component EscR|nr:hypothetical protein [Candidatus Marsarchaeota archaeon]
MEKSKPLAIYVAGPYTPQTNDIHDAARLANINTQNAIDAGIEVLKKGHFPYIPHLSHYVHLRMKDGDALPKEAWYSFDMTWLAKCDALLYLAPSFGADAELKWAREHGMKIFLRIEEIPDISGNATKENTSHSQKIKIRK